MPPEDVSSGLEELSARVEELERRLSALELLSQSASSSPEFSGAPFFLPPHRAEAPSGRAQSNLFSDFGRAVLGIAGAYLLRAAAESGFLASWLAVSFALAYAAAWLVWAAWPGGKARLTCYCYAITAGLILSPLLWEATVRFRMLDPPVSAALLAAFALLAMVLAWGGGGTPVIWVGMLTAVITAFLLLVATRDPVPFTAALLVMALMSEFAAVRGRWRVLRSIVAAAADFSVLVLLLILGDAGEIPQDYHRADPAVLIALVVFLFLIYAASAGVRSLVSRLKITWYEVVQFTAAVLLAGWGVLRITQGEARLVLGACCLAAGAACYFAAFGLRARHSEQRNFHFYATYGCVLLTAGSFLALPPAPLVIWLSAAAVVATGLGVRVRSPVLELHGVAYLSGAVVAAGLLAYAGRALAGEYPSKPGALCILVAAAALLCTALVSRYRGEHAIERLLRLLPAILAVYTAAGIAVAGIVALIAHGAAPTLPQLAVVRTAVTCAAALLLAFFGARFRRLELVWMAYAAAILGCLKLLFEDLRFGSTQSLAASLLIYGAVLILIPRLVRTGKRLA
jgi:hypothetical protein